MLEGGNHVADHRCFGFTQRRARSGAAQHRRHHCERPAGGPGVGSPDHHARGGEGIFPRYPPWTPADVVEAQGDHPRQTVTNARTHEQHERRAGDLRRPGKQLVGPVTNPCGTRAQDVHRDSAVQHLPDHRAGPLLMRGPLGSVRSAAPRGPQPHRQPPTSGTSRTKLTTSVSASVSDSSKSSTWRSPTKTKNPLWSNASIATAACFSQSSLRGRASV